MNLKVEPRHEEIDAEGYRRTIVDYYYRFTIEEKEQLHDILNKYSRDRIERFIGALEFCCTTYKEIILERKKQDSFLSSESKYDAFLEKALKKLDEVFEYLKFVSVPKPVTDLESFFRTSAQFGKQETQNEFEKQYEEISQKCREAHKALWEVEKSVKQYRESLKLKEGRPKADSDAFVKLLARVYSEHFEPPTAYMDGPFVNIVSISLDGLGLPSQDPRRRIKAAIGNPGDFPAELISFLSR